MGLPRKVPRYPRANPKAAAPRKPQASSPRTRAKAAKPRWTKAKPRKVRPRR